MPSAASTAAMVAMDGLFWCVSEVQVMVHQNKVV